MKRLYQDFWAKIVLLCSIFGQTASLLWSKGRPTTPQRAIETQQPVTFGSRDWCELEHTHLESENRESRERPPVSIAPPVTAPFVPDDDAWQVPLFATRADKNQHYIYGYDDDFVPPPEAKAGLEPRF
jgi:hypothetical protein